MLLAQLHNALFEPFEKGGRGLRELATSLVFRVDYGGDEIFGKTVCDSLLEVFRKVAEGVVAPFEAVEEAEEENPFCHFGGGSDQTVGQMAQ